MAQVSLTPTPPGGEEPLPPPVRRGRLARLRRALAPVLAAQGMQKWALWAGFLLTTLFLVLAIFAPLIAPYGFDAFETDGERFPHTGEPSADHPFGTNNQFFDVMTRVVFGARTALQVMVFAVVISLVIGVPLGLISGYFGGVIDRVLVLVMDALFAFPSLLLAIAAAFVLSQNEVLGKGVATAAIAITVVYIPQYFRVVRNSTVSAREATYVEAARAIGARPRTIISRYLFANVVQSVPVIATLNAADAIATLAGLGFLGYGVEPTEAAEWGYDLQRAITDAQSGIWWTALFPGLAIVLSVTGLTLVGEGLNDTLNPTLRKRRFRRVVLPPPSVAITERTPVSPGVPADDETTRPGSPREAGEREGGDELGRGPDR